VQNRQYKPVSPRKATGEVRHDPPAGDRRDPSQLPHKEGAHPLSRRPIPGPDDSDVAALTLNATTSAVLAPRTASERYTSPTTPKGGSPPQVCRGDIACGGISEESPRHSSGARATAERSVRGAAQSLQSALPWPRLHRRRSSRPEVETPGGVSSRCLHAEANRRGGAGLTITHRSGRSEANPQHPIA